MSREIVTTAGLRSHRPNRAWVTMGLVRKEKRQKRRDKRQKGLDNSVQNWYSL